MKKQILNTGMLLALLATVAFLEVGCSPTAPEPGKTERVAATPAASPAAACKPPTAMAGSNEETAWQLFVAATCKVSGTQYLTYQTWTEQTCFNDPSSPGCGPAASTAAPVRHLHGSVLRQRFRHPALEATVPSGTPGGCGSMTQISPKSPLNPFVPGNITANATFCEEVYVNQSEAAYVNAPAAGATLTNLTAQVAYAQGTPIKFPTPSIEIKADWLPADSVNPALDCAKPPAGVYTEIISGKCYALVGIHVSSKLLPEWLWATFEPQSTLTNPNRCKPDLYSSCNDPWGSSPAVSTGQSTSATTALTNLMNQAGLPPEFLNYRLTGAQSSFVDANNKAIELGNSFVEFNAGVPPHEASCMTCHAYAMVSTVAQENPNLGNFPPTPPPTGAPTFPGTPPIGTPGKAPLPAQGGGTWVPQDFSWMLGVMPPKAKANP